MITMTNIIEIKDLNFSIQQKTILKNLDLTIKKGSFTTILGPSGSGKSTLIRLLVGLEKSNGHISIDDTILNSNNLKEIRKKIGLVFENPDNQFIAETVENDIIFTLENLSYSKQEIKNRLEKIVERLKLESILYKSPHDLSGGEKQLVALASALVMEPQILILDEAFAMIEPKTKTEILTQLQKIHKETDITILMITHDTNDSLYGDNIILMQDGSIIAQGTKEEIYQYEKLFRELDLELPFMVDLSIKLKYYGLVDKIIYSMNEMVDVIWK